MAKKDKADKTVKAGTKKTGRIPKQIAGVKLSKQFRKSGEKLIEKAQTPQGRQVIAAGLAMATAAIAKAKANAAHTAPTPPEPPVPPQAPIPPVPPKPPLTPGTTEAGTPMADPAQIAEAVGQAATAFFDGLFGRKR